MPGTRRRPTNEEVEYTPDGTAPEDATPIEDMTPSFKAAFLHAKKHGNPDKAAYNFARDNEEKEPFASAE